MYTFNKLSPRQILIPAITTGIICFMYFGPVTRTLFENIIISIIIILAAFIEFKGKAFVALGFQRDKLTFTNLLVLAPLVALALFAFYAFILLSVVTLITGQPIDLSQFENLKGNLQTSLITLLVIWVTAGFGEEIIFRGFFMKQFAKFFGENRLSTILNILLVSSFFGFMHSQQGITGQLLSGSIGAILALIFYQRKYDLWFIIAVHGFFDTIAIFYFYFGFT